MSIVRTVIGGVDTHADFHVAAVIDGNGGMFNMRGWSPIRAKVAGPVGAPFKTVSQLRSLLLRPELHTLAQGRFRLLRLLVASASATWRPANDRTSV